MSNLSFEQIRKAMSVNVATAPSAALEKTKKAVSAVGSFVGGVLPATNNALDERTERLLELLVITQMDLSHLRDQLGMDINPEEMDQQAMTDAVSMYMSSFKKKREKAVEPQPQMTAPGTVEQSRLQAFLQGGTQEAPAPSAAPVVNVAPVVGVSKPTTLGDMTVSMESPTEWHKM
jgi:hypothetical protein